MIQDIGFFFISGFGIYMVVISIRHIMIGLNKINHPMYDNDEKRKRVFKYGIIGLIIGVMGSAFFCFFSVQIILMEINK